MGDGFHGSRVGDQTEIVWLILGVKTCLCYLTVSTYCRLALYCYICFFFCFTSLVSFVCVKNRVLFSKDEKRVFRDESNTL